MLQKRRNGTPVADKATQHPPSIVSADMTVVGDLTTPGEVHIDGTVEGNVKSARVTVGRDGRVIGGVDTELLDVHGTVNGSVHAATVTLYSTARLNGDVVHDRLRVEAGAVIHGVYRRAEASDTSPRLRAEANLPLPVSGSGNRKPPVHVGNGAVPAAADARGD